jgi:spermidine/putrescine transport system substrate-binding protein
MTNRPMPPFRRLSPAALSRRRFLRGLGVFGAGAIVAPSLLAACGGDDDETGTTAGSDAGTTAAGSPDTTAAGGGGLTISNWPLYIDDETVSAFQEATGISVNYTEDYNDNDEFFAKIQPALSDGQAIDQDIIVPTDWLASRLIGLGWLEELPIEQIPNAANLTASLRNRVGDPKGAYTLPWQSIMAGIAYNREVTGRDLTSMADLLDPEFKGKIGMLTEMRDTVGLFMLHTGADITNPTFEAATPAFDLIAEAAASGQIRQFTGNDYMDDLVSGNFAACIGWSGDVAQLTVDNDKLGFAIPESGGTLSADLMVIPKGAANVANAAKWMDFVYDPVNAARIAVAVQYISPVAGVQEVLRENPETAAHADNPLMFPDEETLSKLSSFGPLDEDDEARFDERFAEITGA